jgi:hypothetical protein
VQLFCFLRLFRTHLFALLFSAPDIIRGYLFLAPIGAINLGKNYNHCRPGQGWEWQPGAGEPWMSRRLQAIEMSLTTGVRTPAKQTSYNGQPVKAAQQKRFLKLLKTRCELT